MLPRILWAEQSGDVMKYVVKALQAYSTAECLWLRCDNGTVICHSVTQILSLQCMELTLFAC